MAKYSDAIRDAIIAAFQAGDQPTEAQFTNWITRIQEGIEEHDHDGTGDGDGIAAIGITGITGVGVDVPVNWYLGRGAALGRLVFDDNGLSIMGAQLGIGILAQVAGVANMIVWEGPNDSMAGPHLQISTDADAYPLFQMINWSHDNIEMYFDAYLDAVGYKSSDAGSSFGIVKSADEFHIKYGVAVAGAAVVLTDGFVMDTFGGVALPAYGIGDAQFLAGGVFTSVSDASLKRDIHDTEIGLAEVLQMQGKRWRFTEKSGLNDKDNTMYQGFVADDIEKIVPAAVGRRKDGMRTMSYSSLLPAFAEAFREIDARLTQGGL